MTDCNEAIDSAARAGSDRGERGKGRRLVRRSAVRQIEKREDVGGQSSWRSQGRVL